jgi:hypothetical protein
MDTLHERDCVSESPNNILSWHCCPCLKSFLLNIHSSTSLSFSECLFLWELATHGAVYYKFLLSIVMGIDWVPGEKGSYGGNALVAAAVAIAAVQIIFVVARFYTRFIQRTKIGFDDYLILLALV